MKIYSKFGSVLEPSPNDQPRLDFEPRSRLSICLLVHPHPPIEWWYNYRRSGDTVRRGMVEDLGSQKFWEYRELLVQLYTKAKSFRCNESRLGLEYFRWPGILPN